MNTIQSLSLRTNAALTRLAELQRRAEHTGAAQASVVRPAMKELTNTLEELQVANEQLHEYVSALVEVRQTREHMAALHEEFVNTLPLPCLWTDAAGVIIEANEATALLLNVGTSRLTGKPLSLYCVTRLAFFEALDVLKASTVVEITTRVRPRERRAREVRLTGRRLRHDERICWFLREIPGSVDGQASLDAVHQQLASPDETR